MQTRSGFDSNRAFEGDHLEVALQNGLADGLFANALVRSDHLDITAFDVHLGVNDAGQLGQFVL